MSPSEQGKPLASGIGAQGSFAPCMRGAMVLGMLLFWLLEMALAQQLFSPAQEPLAGSRLFGTKGCVKCHAIRGTGGEIGPDLGRIAQPRSFYDLAAAMWNHLPGMAERLRQLDIASPRLDSVEMGNLMAFLFTIDYFDPPGNPAAGQKLFVTKRCVVCHQVEGIGGVVGPNLDFLGQYDSPLFIAAAMWNHGPGMVEAIHAKGIEWPPLKGSELEDLMAYFKANSQGLVQGPIYVLPGRVERGRWLFTEKGCLACHSVQGQGGHVGPDLGESGRGRSLTDFAAAMWNKMPAMLKAMEERRLAVPELRPGDIADIVAYLYAVRYFADAGEPAKGRDLVTERCLGCHSLDGTGEGDAGDLAQVRGLDSQAAVMAALWNHLTVMGQKPKGQRDSWPRFHPQEMADLVVYLQSRSGSRQ